MWRSLSFPAAVLAACLAVCGCTGPRAPVAGAPGSATAAGADYVIGPGDTLSVFVYRAPELSVPNLPVRPDGRVSVPLVPDIQASGLTPTQLAHEIEQRLKTYVRDPVVTVMVTNFVGPLSRQVRVIGEAAEPAALPYREHMTLLDVMIATKGLTKYAAGNSAKVIRRTPDGREVSIPVRLGDLMRDGDISQNIEMRPGDTLIIPQSWF